MFANSLSGQRKALTVGISFLLSVTGMLIRLPAAESPLPSFRDQCFTPFDMSKGLPQVKELHRFFDSVAGQPDAIRSTQTRKGACGAIHGWVKLKAPWTDDTVLRVMLADYDRLQIHLYRGDRGAALVHHEQEPRNWVGYVTERTADMPQPSAWYIAATDEGRSRRTSAKGHDQYELRCRDGEVVWSRGDISLLRVPLAGLPDEIYFHGSAAFHGLDLVRTHDSLPRPDPLPACREIALNSIQVEKQLHQGSRLDHVSPGGLRLSVPSGATTESWVAFPRPRDALGELFLELSEVTNGSGIYFGSGKASPDFGLRFVRDQRRGQLCVRPYQRDVPAESDSRDINEVPYSSVAVRHWLRLVFGAGQVRWWISPDGVHWAEPMGPIRIPTPEVTHIGLHCAGSPEPAGITLRSIQFRPLSTLESLADAAAFSRGLAVSDSRSPTLAAWSDSIMSRIPASLDRQAWRRACAIKTLAAGCPGSLANELLLELIEDDSIRERSASQRLRLLDEVALVLDGWHDARSVRRFVRRFHTMALADLDISGEPPFSAIRSALMTTPLASQEDIEVATEELLRAELIVLVYGRQWRRISQLARELRFFQLQTKSPLLDWAEALAMRELPELSGLEGVVYQRREEWREPLIEELSKDVYNVLATLRGELNSGSVEDAARTIASLDGNLTGLAPHWRDDRLLVSLPAAIQSAVHRDKSLRKQLAASYTDLAWVRVHDAITRRDARAVEFAAIQFAGSAAASEAHRWLGDLALADGHFASAAARYHRAAAGAPAAAEAEILAKRQLAQTLADQDEVGGVTWPAEGVTLGGSRMTAEQFQQLLAELRKRVTPEKRPWVTDNGKVDRQIAGLPRVPYTVQRHVRLEGLLGNNPEREFARDVDRLHLDWVDRQLGVAVQNGVMYISNRFQVTAYDLERNQRIWQTAAPSGPIQFAQESTLIAARPLVARDRLFVRLLFTPGAMLAAVDRQNGQFVWTSSLPPNEEYVSDPLLLHGELACLKVVRGEQQDSVLRLVTIDQRTGFPWREWDILRLNDTWRLRRCGEQVVVDDSVIAALGGIVVRVTDQGNVRWIRRQTVLPPDEEPQWVKQSFQPPIAEEGRLYVAQPGVRVVECLEDTTGELVWSRLFLDLERLIAVAGPRLICQTSHGLLALDKHSGETRWDHAADGYSFSTGVLCSSDAEIIYVQRVVSADSRSPARPRLVWIDAATGRTQGSLELLELADGDPQIGPLIIHQNRLWTFWGRSPSDPIREVVELRPSSATR